MELKPDMEIVLKIRRVLDDGQGEAVYAPKDGKGEEEEAGGEEAPPAPAGGGDQEMSSMYG